MANASSGFLPSDDGYFPSTHATWILRTLAEEDGGDGRVGGVGGIAAVRRHVMERYRDALVA